MTVMLVSDVFPPKVGGSGRWFWEIYGRLPRETFLVAAGVAAGQAEFDRGHDLRVERVPLTLRAWGVADPASLLAYLRRVRCLRRLIDRHRVTMLHAARCLPEGLMALMLRSWIGIPYACFAHGEDVTTATTSRELRWLVMRVLRGADFLIANSRNTARILVEDWGMPPYRVHILHPGVDTLRFVPGPIDPVERGRLGWHDRPVVLTVGRLQKRKGHDRMILALRELRSSVPDVLYAIVGEGEERASLEMLAAREGVADHVQFLGEVDDEQLIRCYQQCDLFVLPNRQVGMDIEGFGMVLLEAQACGKPVIAGDSGGTAETMKIPQTGRIVDCSRPELLAAAVGAMLGDREQLAAMGEAARDWVCETFDWDGLAREAERLFNRAPAAVEA